MYLKDKPDDTKTAHCKIVKEFINLTFSVNTLQTTAIAIHKVVV